MYHFDNERKEITFDKYNTPTPWMNYLSNGSFHTMISHCGGGVAFCKSPQIFRINHYRFFHLTMDRSGFYTYIRDGNLFRGKGGKLSDLESSLPGGKGERNHVVSLCGAGYDGIRAGIELAVLQQASALCQRFGRRDPGVPLWSGDAAEARGDAAHLFCIRQQSTRL